MKKIAFILFCASSILFLSSCKKDEEETTIVNNVEVPTGEFKLEMEHNYGMSPLALNTTYTNVLGEEFQFNNFKYYLTNIKIKKADGSVWSQPESYYLVDLSSTGSLILDVPNVPEGDYTSIEFMIGVDSTRNVSGAQTGALAVSNNMFWTWSTGYIMAKFEGTSPQAPGGTFSYHVGGFQGANASQQILEYAFAPAMLMIRRNAAPQIHMSVDAQKIFENDINISIHDNPTVHQPGLMARRVIQNFVSGVEYEHIHN